MEKRHTIIIDIGNSRVKYYFSKATYYDLPTLISSLGPGYNHIIDCFIVAANPKIGQEFLDKFRKLLSETQASLGNSYVFDPENKSPLTKIYSGLGGDRIAKLSGALAMFPGSNIMLMDFGTATTLNLANKNHEFIGGFVNLGLQASIEAISDKLIGFPDYTKTEEFKKLITGINLKEIFPSESPAKAVIEGAYREHLAMIQYYKNYVLEKFNGEKFISIATGGNAGIFSSEFDKSIDSRDLLEAFVDSLQGLKS